MLSKKRKGAVGYILIACLLVVTFILFTGHFSLEKQTALRMQTLTEVGDIEAIANELETLVGNSKMLKTSGDTSVTRQYGDKDITATFKPIYVTKKWNTDEWTFNRNGKSIVGIDFNSDFYHDNLLYITNKFSEINKKFILNSDKNSTPFNYNNLEETIKQKLQSGDLKFAYRVNGSEVQYLDYIDETSMQNLYSDNAEAILDVYFVSTSDEVLDRRRFIPSPFSTINTEDEYLTFYNIPSYEIKVDDLFQFDGDKLQNVKYESQSTYKDAKEVLTEKVTYNIMSNLDTEYKFTLGLESLDKDGFVEATVKLIEGSGERTVFEGFINSDEHTFKVDIAENFKYIDIGSYLTNDISSFLPTKVEIEVKGANINKIKTEYEIVDNVSYQLLLTDEKGTVLRDKTVTINNN